MPCLAARPHRFDPEVKRKPRRLPMGLLSWVSPTIFYPEDEVIALSGMDVAVFLRLLSYGEPPPPSQHESWAWPRGAQGGAGASIGGRRGAEGGLCCVRLRSLQPAEW